MPRTKGSKNKPKTVTADFAFQIVEKQSERKALSTEIASITANVDSLKKLWHFMIMRCPCRPSVKNWD